MAALKLSKQNSLFSSSLAEKLKTARASTGLSTRRVAELLSKRSLTSHATIANYESGKSTPDVEVLGLLAEIYQRPITWFLEKTGTLSGIQYRNLKSRTKANDLHKYEAEVKQWIDTYIAVEQSLNRPIRKYKIQVKSTITALELSQQVRRDFGLSCDEPIPSIIEVLEFYGIRVMEQTTNLKIDGLAAEYRDEFVVVINPSVSNDRIRMNAGHELGHILFGDCKENVAPNDKVLEARAFEFASCLLLPNSQLKRAFEGKSVVKMVQYKERFGISLAAMVYRASKLKFITASEAKWFWIEFAKRGWKSKEPGVVRPDRAVRFEQLLEEAMSSGQLSIDSLTRLAGVKADAIRNRLVQAVASNRSLIQDGQAKILKFPST